MLERIYWSASHISEESRTTDVRYRVSLGTNKVLLFVINALLCHSDVHKTTPNLIASIHVHGWFPNSMEEVGLEPTYYRNILQVINPFNSNG